MSPLLLAVHRIVGGVEIDDDARGRLGMCILVERHEQPLDRAGIVCDLVVGISPDLRRMLEPVERRLAGERRAVGALRGQAPGEDAQHRVMSQLIMIVDILVAERDADDALAQQARQLMDDGVRIAAILEALRQPRHQTDRLVGLTEQQRAGVRSDPAAVESAHNNAAFGGSEIERILATLCRHRGVPSSCVKSLLHNNFR
jgi:hypothetical protein